MVERKCSTCKHFEAAPMWKKGWCRNPLLYSPQQSHLVGEDDLDCNRGMGSYWEALDSEVGEDEPLLRFSSPTARTIATAPRGPHGVPARRPNGQGATLPRPVARPLAPGRREPAPARAAATDLYDAPPHQPWGDYLRRGFPALIVILGLGAFWLMSSRMLPQGDLPSVSTPVVTASLSQPVSVLVPTAVPSAASAPDASAPPAPPAGLIAPGARVVVASGSNGANIRESPALRARPVRSVADGTPLTIAGESQEADGYTWWPVEGEAARGWVAGSLLEPAP